MLLEVDKKRPEVADAFIGLIGLALAREADPLAQAMFDLVQVLRPDSPQIAGLHGWFCLRQGDVVAAGRHLRSAVTALGDEAGTARTLLAIVLCAQGDPSWRAHAQIIIADGRDANSVALLTTLMMNEKVLTSKASEQTMVETQSLLDSHEPKVNSQKLMYLRA
jgi:type III secretion system HrpB1/HrpK family protein